MELYQILIIITILIVIVIVIIYINQQNVNKKAISLKKNTNLTDSTSKENVSKENTSKTNSKTSSTGTTDTITDKTKDTTKKSSSMSDNNAEAGSNPTILTSLKDGIVDLAKNPIFWAATLGSIVGELLLKKIIEKVTTKIIEKVGEKVGIKIAETLGIKLGEKVAVAAGVKVGEQVAVKAGESVAVKIGLAAGSLATSALNATMIAGLLLDFGDMLIPGGLAGYARMGTNQSYFEIRDNIDKQLNKALTDAGASVPYIIGPLSKLSEDDLAKLLGDQLINITTATPIDSLMEPLYTAIAKDIKDGTLTEDGLSDDSVMQKYYDLLDFDAITKKALTTICLDKNGRPVVDSLGNQTCTYKTREDCNASYSTPLLSTDTYAEFRNGESGTNSDGICKLASNAMRDSICKENKIPYDDTIGSCKIDENYCRSKGAQWKFNSKINANDCLIKADQQALEFIFGTTITRGLIQVFSTDQYNQCDPGEHDIGYLCEGAKCGPDQELNASLCYNKCNPGFSGVGPVCWANCPDGYPDYGVGCSKPASYGNGVGRLPDKGACDPGQRDDGTSCWEDLHCNTSCPGGGPWYNVANCRTECSGCGCIKKTLMDRGLSCKEGEEFMYGGICYPNCRPGFHNVGGNVCSPDCPPNTTDIGAACQKNTYDRGAGTPGAYSRPKTRKIDYSNRTN